MEATFSDKHDQPSTASLWPTSTMPQVLIMPMQPNQAFSCANTDTGENNGFPASQAVLPGCTRNGGLNNDELPGCGWDQKSRLL